jgi:hypothetical protein
MMGDTEVFQASPDLYFGLEEHVDEDKFGALME